LNLKSGYNNLMIEKKRAVSILGIIMIIYASLVATHEGEFWPFSIYPMFSQAGNPWTRSFVRDVTSEDRPIQGDIQSNEELYGVPFALNTVGVHQNDLSNFMSKNKDWTPEKKEAVRKYFESVIDEKELLVYKVSGALGDQQVDFTYKPYVYITTDTTTVFE